MRCARESSELGATNQPVPSGTLGAKRPSTQRSHGTAVPGSRLVSSVGAASGWFCVAPARHAASESVSCGGSTGAWHPSGFVRPAGARATFSLLAQRESSQRETAPRGSAFRPSMDGKSVRRGRAFRAGIVPARKGEAIPGLARCAAFRTPPHRRRGAPRRAARIVRARSQSITRPAAGGARTLCFGRADARLPLWGSYGAAGGLRIVRQDGPQGGGPVFRRHTEVPSENPAAHPRTRRARHRGGLSFGYFSLAIQRKVARTPKGRSKPLQCRASRRCRTKPP